MIHGGLTREITERDRETDALRKLLDLPLFKALAKDVRRIKSERAVAHKPRKRRLPAQDKPSPRAARSAVRPAPIKSFRKPHRAAR